MSEVLTPIERRIYNYLVDYLKRETFQPSIREIGTRFGIRSTKTVTEHLQSLQRKGYLDRTPSRSRALKILGLNLSPDTYTIPLYKNAEPVGDDVEARFDIDRSLACSADCFMVRVTGDFSEHGVFRGDLILVEPCADAESSALAVYDRDGAIELRESGNGFQASSGSGSNPNGLSGDSSSRFIGALRAVLRVLPRD